MVIQMKGGARKEKNMTGNEAVLIDFPGQKKKAWKRDKLNKNKKGSVYERGGKLYVYFFYKNEREDYA